MTTVSRSTNRGSSQKALSSSAQTSQSTHMSSLKRSEVTARLCPLKSTMKTTTKGTSPGTSMTKSAANRSKSFILPESEWKRMTTVLDGTGTRETSADARRRERETLHQMSNDMVKTWSNTLEGQRLKRLERLSVKAAKEEEEHKKLDAEEAVFQAERRKEAIAKASEGLMHQTDRVKKFHESLVLSEVLRERDAQVAFKQRKAALKEGMDHRYVRQMEADRQKALHDDMVKREERMAASHETRVYLSKQASEKEEKRREERRQALREQLECEKIAQQFFDEQTELERKFAQQKKDTKRVYDSTLDDKIAAVQQRELEDQIEEREAQLFASAKQTMVRKRKHKEKDILQAVRDRQDVMCKKLHGMELQQRDDEENEIAEAREETYAKMDKAAKEKQDMYVKRQREINKHRDRVMEAHEEQRKQDAQRQIELRDQQMELDRKFQLQQLKEEALIRDRKTVVQKFQVQQVHDLMDREQAEIDEEKKAFEENEKRFVAEEKYYQQYTQKVINEAKERQAPVGVMERAAGMAPCGGHGPKLVGRGGIKPSYMAMDAFGTELKNVSVHSTLPKIQTGSKAASASRSFGSTKKRTGHVW